MKDELLRAFVAMVVEDEGLLPKWREGARQLASDSLAGLRLEHVASARRLADVGSGAGFPGLVLAIALPHTSVALIERKPERQSFLRRAVRALELDNAEVVAVDAQDWDLGRGAHDVVTSRNVAPPNVIVELAAPLLKLGGVAVLWERRRSAMYEAEGDAAAAVVGLRREEMVEEGRRCFLYVYRKIRGTPSEFPRPNAAAYRAPLGLEIDPAEWKPDGGTVRLRPFQQQVLELMAGAKTRDEIAEALDLTTVSARNEIRRVQRKLAAKTIDEAVARARGCGLLPAP
jgi:16S rRNA (guanine527-N7)-methyltransferase